MYVDIHLYNLYFMHTMVHAFCVQIVSTCESGRGDKVICKNVNLFSRQFHTVKCYGFKQLDHSSAFVTTVTSYCLHNEKEATQNWYFQEINIVRRILSS